MTELSTGDVIRQSELGELINLQHALEDGAKKIRRRIDAGSGVEPGEFRAKSEGDNPAFDEPSNGLVIDGLSVIPRGVITQKELDELFAREHAMEDSLRKLRAKLDCGAVIEPGVYDAEIDGNTEQSYVHGFGGSGVYVNDNSDRSSEQSVRSAVTDTTTIEPEDQSEFAESNENETSFSVNTFDSGGEGIRQIEITPEEFRAVSRYMVRLRGMENGPTNRPGAEPADHSQDWIWKTPDEDLTANDEPERYVDGAGLYGYQLAMVNNSNGDWSEFLELTREELEQLKLELAKLRGLRPPFGDGPFAQYGASLLLEKGHRVTYEDDDLMERDQDGDLIRGLFDYPDVNCFGDITLFVRPRVSPREVARLVGKVVEVIAKEGVLQERVPNVWNSYTEHAGRKHVESLRRKLTEYAAS